MSRGALSAPFEIKKLRHNWFSEELRRRNIAEAAEHLREQEISQAKRTMRANAMPLWVADIVMACAIEFGVAPCAILSVDRHKAVVLARHAAIYRTKDTKPMLSLSRLGKWFGRDYTTVAHALAMHQRRHGLHSYTRHNVEKHMDIMREWHRSRALDRRHAAAGE